jgi:hypothetical protein
MQSRAEALKHCAPLEYLRVPEADVGHYRGPILKRKVKK